MGKYKLVYFDARGRAEVARMLFKLAGEEFEDKRVDRDKWPELKKTTLLGQIPFLEVDGEEIYQSRSIERFLARKFGFAGKSELEQAKVDMIQESMEDGLKPLFNSFKETDEEKKAALKKKVEDEDLPQFLNVLETLLKSNRGGDSYFVGDGLTLADLSVVQLLTFPVVIGGLDIKLDNFPKLKAHKERIESQPKIAEWIATRPKTQF